MNVLFISKYERESGREGCPSGVCGEWEARQRAADERVVPVLVRSLPLPQHARRLRCPTQLTTTRTPALSNFSLISIHWWALSFFLGFRILYFILYEAKIVFTFLTQEFLRISMVLVGFNQLSQICELLTNKNISVRKNSD